MSSTKKSTAPKENRKYIKWMVIGSIPSVNLFYGMIVGFFSILSSNTGTYTTLICKKAILCFFVQALLFALVFGSIIPEIWDNEGSNLLDIPGVPPTRKALAIIIYMIVIGLFSYFFWRRVWNKKFTIDDSKDEDETIGRINNYTSKSSSKESTGSIISNNSDEW